MIKGCCAPITTPERATVSRLASPFNRGESWRYSLTNTLPRKKKAIPCRAENTDHGGRNSNTHRRALQNPTSLKRLLKYIVNEQQLWKGNFGASFSVTVSARALTKEGNEMRTRSFPSFYYWRYRRGAASKWATRNAFPITAARVLAVLNFQLNHPAWRVLREFPYFPRDPPIGVFIYFFRRVTLLFGTWTIDVKMVVLRCPWVEGQFQTLICFPAVKQSALSVSWGTISNSDLLSSSETEVDPGIKSWKKT